MISIQSVGLIIILPVLCQVNLTTSEAFAINVTLEVLVFLIEVQKVLKLISQHIEWIMI